MIKKKIIDFYETVVLHDNCMEDVAYIRREDVRDKFLDLLDFYMSNWASEDDAELEQIINLIVKNT